MNEPNFVELVGRAKRGESDSVLVIVKRYGEAVLRQARIALRHNWLRRNLDAEDLFQSVMGQFFTELRAGRFEFDTPAQLVALLREMARNEIARQARYWTASRRDCRRNVGLPRTGDGIEPVSPDPTPIRVASDAELLSEFKRRLPQQERHILTLRMQGASWDVVAACLGVGPEAARKRLERSSNRIARKLRLRA